MTNLSQQSTYELVSISNHWTAEPEAVHCTVKCILPMLKMQWKTRHIKYGFILNLTKLVKTIQIYTYVCTI